MATMPERMAVVETEVRAIKETTSETRADVKLLLAWRDEERGGRKSRANSVRYVAIVLTVITIATNIALRLV